MKRFCALVAVALLSACSPAPAPSAPAAPLPAQTSEPAPAILPSPHGEWRLLSLTGHTVEGQQPIRASFAHSFVDAASQCVPFRFAFTAGNKPNLFDEWAPPDGVAMCARDWSALEKAFDAFMTTATKRELARPDRLVLTGPRGEAVFVREPAPARAAPSRGQQPPSKAGFWGVWRVAAINGAAPPADLGMEISLGFERAEVRSGCVALFFLAPYLADESRAFSVWENRVPVCERGPYPEETAVQKALKGAVRVTPEGMDALVLTSAGGAVRLERGRGGPVAGAGEKR